MSKATTPTPLRCRPGDLCIATRPVDHRGRDLPIVGMLFKVVSLTYSRDCGNPCWTYEGPRRMLGEWQLEAVADACLTPIRGDERKADAPFQSTAPGDGLAGGEAARPKARKGGRVVPIARRAAA